VTPRPLALLLLCAQTSGLVHLALAPHAVGASGEALEAGPACPAAEHGPGIAHAHETADLEVDCAAAALARAALELVHPQTAPAPVSAAAAAWQRSPSASPPLEPLVVAPKASPPA
jgi:hypothetical protein